MKIPPGEGVNIPPGEGVNIPPGAGVKVPPGAAVNVPTGACTGASTGRAYWQNGHFGLSLAFAALRSTVAPQLGHAVAVTRPDKSPSSARIAKLH